MTTLNDCRFEGLRGQAYQGATNDMLLLWLQDNGATSSTLSDAWHEFLKAQGAVGDHRNDMMLDWLDTQGFTGARNDAEKEFWCVTGGVLGPAAVRAVIQNDNRNSVIVTFNGAPSGTLNSQVTYTVDGGGAQTFDSAAPGPGANDVTYTRTADFQDGDVVRWIYAGTPPGNIQVGGEDLPAQDKLVDNRIEGMPTVDTVIADQTEIPSGQRIIRRAEVRVSFANPVQVVPADASGVTITVHGVQVVATYLSGSGTNTLVYTVPRAIFRHAVTWAYDEATGNITNLSGDPLGDVAPTAASNLMPQFTVWDWDAGAPTPEATDTQWDNDETRFDEEAA